MNKDIFDVDKAYFVLDSNNLDTVDTRIYGFAVEENGIIDEDNLPTDRELSLSGNGTYVYIYRERERERENSDRIVIHQDFNGSYGLYLFRKDDYFAISNSFLYLVEHIKNNFLLSFNRDFANELILNSVRIETACNTIINEITLIGINQYVAIDISAKSLSIFNEDNTIHSFYVDTQEGIELLDSWFSKWTGIIYNIIEQNRMEHVNLSGGFDSRITFMLALLSSADLCKTNILSINDNLHCHAEDFEIVSSIAEYFNFSLNKSCLPKNSKFEYFSLKDILNKCFYGKIFFHKEMYFKYSRNTKKMFNLPGSGGESIRSLYNKSHQEYKDYVKSICKRYTLNTCNEISQSIENLFNASFSYIINKYNISGDNNPEIMYWFYREGRSRHHFGKAAVERFHSNLYSLHPFYDPTLHKLNRSSPSCSDQNLLITTILSRYCPDLLKFKVQGNRYFESSTVEYANKINKQYPVNLDKLVQNKRLNNFCIVDKSVVNLNTTNIPVNKEEPYNFLMNAFSSRKFFKTFTRYFNEDIYNFARNHANKSQYHPMRHCYAVIATVLALDIVDANRNIRKNSCFNDLHVLSHDENTYDESQENNSDSSKIKKKSPAKNLKKSVKKILKKLLA